jgi:RNA polymerase-binding transcription factor DksA
MAKSTSGKTSGAVPAGIQRKWAWHYQTLFALRDSLKSDETGKLEEAAEPSRTHLADRGADEFDRDLALALLSKDENALAEVEAALERIRKGTYGICEKTGAPIPPERLRAVPWCRYLREVEARMENSGDVPKPRLI